MAAHWSRGCTRTRGRCERLGVEVNDMPIVPLVFGDPDDAMEACEAALRAGLLRPGHPPADGARGTSRLRLVATATHDLTSL